MTPQIGDPVAWSAAFLKSIGEPPTSQRWFDRGVVAHDTDTASLVCVWWDRTGPQIVGSHNLQHAGRLGRDDPAALGNAWSGMGFQPLY